VKLQNSFILLFASALLFTGCSTKIDLYKYKDVSSVQILDESKANHIVLKPKLSQNIIVDSGRWTSFKGAMRDHFLAKNDQDSIFIIDENGSYKLRLTLQNLESNKQFHPSVFVKNIKEEGGGHYTNPYWSYTVSTMITAQLSLPDGKKKYFEASNRNSFSITSDYPEEVSRDRYLICVNGALDKVQRQLANELAPEGLIISKKVAIDDKDDYIFMVNMGHIEGLRPEQSLRVSKEVIMKNEIDAHTVINKVHIGKATVSNQVMLHHAWIVLDNSDHNSLIEVGDIVRAEY
jgi:hypothetical protein